MSTLNALDPKRRDDVLDEAVARNTAVVLSLREAGAWAIYKTRFLGADVKHRIVVEYPPPNPNGTRAQIVSGENVGIAFRRGHKKCVFNAVVLEVAEYSLNESLRLPSVAVTWPEVVQEMQRRAFYRAPVPRNRQVLVELWQGGAVNRKKAGTATWPSYKGRLLDVSAGGMNVLLPPDQSPHLHTNDAIGIEFKPDTDAPTLLLDGILRHAADTPDGSHSLGIQFSGLESSVEGRRVLQALLHVVGSFQRIEARQARLAPVVD